MRAWNVGALLLGAITAATPALAQTTLGRVEDTAFRQNLGPCTFYVSVPADLAGASTLVRCNFPLLELLYDSAAENGSRLGPFLPPGFDRGTYTLRVEQPRIAVPFAVSGTQLFPLLDGADVAYGLLAADGTVRLYPTGLGPVEEMVFRTDGRLERSGNETTLRVYTYDAVGRVESMGGGGLEILYQWDGQPSVTTGGVTVSLAYTGLELTGAEDDELTRTSMRFTWDRGYLSGAFATVGTDPEEPVIQVTYGATPGVVSGVSLDGKTFTFGYHPNMLEIREAGRLQRRVTFVAGQWLIQVSPAGTMQAQWNAQRRLQSLTDERGVRQVYEYNALGQRTRTAVVHAVTGAETVLETTSYNAAGQVMGTSARNLPEVTRSYDTQYRLLGMSTTAPTSVTVDNTRSESVTVDPATGRTTTDELVTDLLSGYWVRTVKVVDADQAVSTVTDRAGRTVVSTLPRTSTSATVVHQHLAGGEFAWVNP
jgi:YD repeat-containing protein